ncbi:MAG: tetratricopeptide repeat protein, partial [Planctomycetes bacterium]|nr:tetratricopeptide repeat protein [Planctomycetota bacterium]
MARETYIVDTPWPEAPALYGAELARLQAWIHEPGARAAAVTGGAGVGKTSLVGRLLLGEADRLEGVKRIGCWPGIQPEEIAAELANFLMHLGYGRPGAALEQRLPIASKLRILAGSLSLAKAVVWFDDFDLAVPEEVWGSSGEVRRILLDALVEASEGKTRFVFTGTESIPGFRSLWGDGALELALGGLQPEEGDALFRSLGDSPSLRWELLPASVRHLPFAVVLLARIGAKIGPSAVLAMEEPGRENLSGILDRVWDELPLGTRKLLGGLALVDEPIPAGLLRTFLEPPGMGSAVGPALDWDLIYAGAPLSNRYFVHRQVRSYARSRLERDEPAEVAACLSRAGAYFERLAQASRTTWDRLRARRYFYRAGRHEKAYDLQKEVLEELLRKGYLDLAEQILDETARTTQGQHRAVALGNLAIIHKNQGDYEKALEIYRQVHREFEALGDRPNLARVLHQLGNTYYLKGALDDAIE